MALIETEEAARRLARAIASDLSLYNEEKVVEGITNDSLYEVMAVGEELKELILVGASGLELRRKAIDEGMLTLRASGLRKVKDGMTTIEEVVRETVK